MPSPISNLFPLFNFSSLAPLASQMMIDMGFLLLLAGWPQILGNEPTTVY